jgi:hypothetical protein
MKRIIITVANDEEAEIINQVLAEAEEVDPAVNFAFDFKVEDVEEEDRKARFEGDL